jgi:hypothetical protein
MQTNDSDNSLDDIPPEEFQAFCDKASSRLRTKIEGHFVSFLIFGAYIWFAYLATNYFRANETPFYFQLLFVVAYLGGGWLLIKLIFRIMLVVFRAAVNREIARRNA